MIEEPTATKTDATGGAEWKLNDAVIQLREWGTNTTYELPDAISGELLVGTARTCDLRLVDVRRFASRRHARLSQDRGTWTLTDAGSKNGLWLDGARHSWFALAPGVEVGIGSLRLIAESQRSIAVRAFLSRILGWSDERRSHVDRALRALRAMATHRAPLVVVGDGELVAVVHGLHRRAFGADAPFVISTPGAASPRSIRPRIASHADVADALRAASGGTLCVWVHRLPEGFDAARVQLERPTSDVKLVICVRADDDVDGGAPGASRIVLPSLSQRVAEFDRIIDEYAADAIATLGARPTSFTSDDRNWTKRRRPKTLAAVETTVTRLVAIREWGGVTRASRELRISHVALSRWLGRRE